MLELVGEHRASLVSFQETKLDTCIDVIVRDLLGLSFDFSLPATNISGGILLAWNRDIWTVANPPFRDFSLTVQLTLKTSGESWWLTSVYGPQCGQLKLQFLDELRSVRHSCSGTWMLCGDFNLMYRAEDKSNGRLHRRMMGRFRRLINDLELQELYLNGRRFTWSNERGSPTFERLDLVHVPDDWLNSFPDHNLSAISTECSDHAHLCC